MTRFSQRIILCYLLALTGCDYQAPHYNAALVQMSNREFGVAAQNFSGLAQNGYAPAQFRLGILYLYGLGVPKNTRHAVHWLEQAARQGNVGAQYTLARLYLEGIGIPRSTVLAMRWLTQLAERGYAPAQYQVGIMYEQGLGADKNNAESVKWIRRAAERDHEEALLKLADAYGKGSLGLPKDSARAEYWRKRTKPKKF